MYILITKIAVFLIGIIGLVLVAYKKGKKDQNLENIERVLKDAKQIKIDERKRAAEPMYVINKRMHKYTRD